MEVVNKLIDTEEALVNQFDHDGKQDAGASSATGATIDVRRSLRRTGAGLRRSMSKSSTRCWTVHARFMKGVLIQSASASSSRGCSVRPRTPSDLEVTEICHPHVATTTVAATTEVAARTTIAATTGDVTTARQRIAVRRATCLPRQKQASPMSCSSTPRDRSASSLAA
jgi:hypothetical protein